MLSRMYCEHLHFHIFSITSGISNYLHIPMRTSKTMKESTLLVGCSVFFLFIILYAQ